MVSDTSNIHRSDVGSDLAHVLCVWYEGLAKSCQKPALWRGGGVGVLDAWKQPCIQSLAALPKAHLEAHGT